MEDLAASSSPATRTTDFPGAALPMGSDGPAVNAASAVATETEGAGAALFVLEGAAVVWDRLGHRGRAGVARRSGRGRLWSGTDWGTRISATENPSYVTHSLQVEALRGIVAVPSKLESTTLVFTYGVDLFYTRLAPSRTYDSLTDEFSYALLLITIAELVAAIIFTWIWSEKKELNNKWRRSSLLWFVPQAYNSSEGRHAVATLPVSQSSGATS
ncbi:hypothetical protein GUJ93_ZPchr0005g14981 [Zizania palustris]|uniref:ER membrane protein complex subunit 1 n=1 Tax=Zizania palustris TaxID=103762 RepID=A0A8J5W0E1_ZIZPA|nr:hypothetical protein GUJ93_ZPchr0005g14981 [Zizania palustris]